MCFIDLASEIRQIGMQIDFRATHPAMTRVATDVEQFHSAPFEFGEHQMPHLVGCQLGHLERIADTVKNILDRPFRERLTGVAMRVRQKMRPFSSAP